MTDLGPILDFLVHPGSAVVLLAAFLAAHTLLRRDATAALERGDMAEAVLCAALSVTLGILNAACLT